MHQQIVYIINIRDNWRFYSDAGQALAYWSSHQFENEPVYHMKVVETFHILNLEMIIGWISYVYGSELKINKQKLLYQMIYQNVVVQ